MKPKQTKKEKIGDAGKPDSDYKLIIVLGTALLLAIILICVIIFTTPTVIT
jgi:hypothetical protein